MNRKCFFSLLLVTLCHAEFFSFAQAKEPSKASLKSKLPSNQLLAQTDDTSKKEDADLSDAYPKPPFKSYISGVGIAQASSENIFIGTPVNRIVTQVLVTSGMHVRKGDILFRLENYDLEADLMARKVEYDISVARFNKLKALPQPEDVMIVEAAFKSSEVSLAQAKNQYEMVRGLQNNRALSQEEINRRLFAYQQAEAKVQEAQANLNKVKAGTWKPDLEIAELETLQAKANIERAQADLDKTVIRSPIDGTILQINIHEGETTTIDSCRSPIMIVGNTDEMFLQVSINQFDAPYFRPNAAAIAFLRGNSKFKFPLEFVRIEPYLVSKQNLTNDINERVDTRVLRVIYRFNQGESNIFVGQQMDVFIEKEQSK